MIVLLSSVLFHPADEHSWQDHVQIELLWTSAFPKLITESAFRLVDCNSDGILDVIFGYGTGVDTLETNQLLCDLYFNGIYPCNGGVKVTRRSCIRLPLFVRLMSRIKRCMTCSTGIGRSKWTCSLELRQVES
jgi:hypothetical protein